jgi:16S rRNA (guanine966-N2)-methyltransferase
VAPAGSATRPTSDRVRESIFASLGSLGAVDGAVVLDLFAGSGAMGIEALSRGAEHVTFVDSDRAARAAVEANLAACGFSDDARIVASPAERFVAERVAAGDRFDLAFLDPPYGFADWAGLLEGLPADLAVAESGTEVPAPPGWEVLRAKRYGRTHVTILESRP